MKITPCPVTGLVLVALLLSGCQQVPVTGRSALSLVRHEDVVRAGGIAFEKLKLQTGVTRDPRMNDQLQRVGTRLSRVVGWDVPDADWEFVVLNQPNVINAHSCAGGKIAVASGFFRIIESDDELAWVVGHEMAHLAARHTDERYSHALLSRSGAVAAAVGAGAAGGLNGAQAAVDLYNLPATMLTLAFDRGQESEADYMGLVYMARAGYEPEHGVRVFEKMVDAKTAAGTPIPSAIFSTHPAYPERTIQLIDKVEEARKVAAQKPAVITPIIIK